MDILLMKDNGKHLFYSVFEEGQIIKAGQLGHSISKTVNWSIMFILKLVQGDPAVNINRFGQPRINGKVNTGSDILC